MISFWLKHAAGMFLNAKTYWMYPPSCSTGSLPAAKAYFVTPPPLERRRKRPCFSGAWHRRRPGGPGWYRAATHRACGVTAMRASQGAASSAQATDRSLPGRPESSFPPLGLLSPPNPLRWAPAGVRATTGRPYSHAEFPARRAGKKIKIRAEQDMRLRSTPMLAPPPAGNHPRGRG